MHRSFWSSSQKQVLQSRIHCWPGVQTKPGAFGNNPTEAWATKADRIARKNDAINRNFIVVWYAAID